MMKTAYETKVGTTADPGEKNPSLIRPTSWPNPSTKNRVTNHWPARKPKKASAMPV
jgi:hypothetical protein